MNEEDCRYGMRKLLDKCNYRTDRFNAGEYKYRCVRYRLWAIKTAKS
jgi:hypothetical protein